jgi:hypothetical protein
MNEPILRESTINVWPLIEVKQGILTSTTMLAKRKNTLSASKTSKKKEQSNINLHSRKRPQNYSISRHERQEPRRLGQYLPRAHHPAPKHCTDHLATANVDVTGEQDHQVVRRAETIRRDIGPHD